MTHCRTTSTISGIPSSYTFRLADAVSVNGSSATGHCSSVATGQGSSRGQIKCYTPTGSVLFDGNIPTLTGLDGDKWASQLLTLRGDTPLFFDFTGTPGYAGVERVELTMFNCPEWGISVQQIGLYSRSLRHNIDFTPILSHPVIH